MSNNDLRCNKCKGQHHPMSCPMDVDEIEKLEQILESDQVIQRFIIEHDKDLPTAQMVTLLAKRLNQHIRKRELMARIEELKSMPDADYFYLASGDHIVDEFKKRIAELERQLKGEE